MATFIELCFHAVGETAHRDAVATIKLISGVDLLLDHTRERGWLERQQLFVEEWDCRIVVCVYDRAEMFEADRQGGDERDPYRTIEFDQPLQRVPSKLADLIEALGARPALVDKGWIRFETRRYEREVLEQLQTELTEIAGNDSSSVSATTTIAPEGVTGSKLTGRLEGVIPAIRVLQGHLLRSGMVDAERVAVGYV